VHFDRFDDAVRRPRDGADAVAERVEGRVVVAVDGRLRPERAL
jgi:hypothetical protein